MCVCVCVRVPPACVSVPRSGGGGGSVQGEVLGCECQRERKSGWGQQQPPERSELGGCK